MIKKLDLYIIKKFLGTFFFVLIISMSVGIIFDVAENIDEFIEHNVPFWSIVKDNYLNFIVIWSNLLSAFIVFIAVIFFTSRMAQRTEIIPILTSGVSFRRMLVPYLIAATILTGLSLYLNHFVLPKANKAKVEFGEKYYWASLRVKDIHREIEPGTIVFFKQYDSDFNYLHKFMMEKWENNKLKYVLNANRAHGDSISNNWLIKDYTIRKIGEQGEPDIITTGRQLDTTFNFVISDFAKRTEAASFMNYYEIDEFIEQERKKGSEDVTLYEIEKHMRTSYPMATYIFTLLGVCISSRKTRGGTGLHIFLGFIVCALYLFSMRFTTVGATNAGLNPLLASWISNIIFAGVAVIFYLKAQK